MHIEYCFHADNKVQSPTSAIRLSPFSSSTGGLLNTTSGAHEGGGESVESTDGEELISSAVKRKCVHSEDSILLRQVWESVGKL